MISVVIPTLNAARPLSEALAALVPAAVDGLVKELIVVDGGSTDATLEVAEDAGARLAPDLKAACAAARGDWLLILPPETVMPRDWETAAAHHMAGGHGTAGYVGAKGRLLRPGPAPGEVGLLISRRLLDEIGGHGDDLARRLGRRRLKPLGIQRSIRMSTSRS